jgi:hypothetical protein
MWMNDERRFAFRGLGKKIGLGYAAEKAPSSAKLTPSMSDNYE